MIGLGELRIEMKKLKSETCIILKKFCEVKKRVKKDFRSSFECYLNSIFYCVFFFKKTSSLMASCQVRLTQFFQTGISGVAASVFTSQETLFESYIGSFIS